MTNSQSFRVDQQQGAGADGAEDHAIQVEQNGFFVTGEMPTDMSGSNRGTLFVTDGLLVGGFDRVYHRSAIDGVPFVALVKGLLGTSYDGVSLEEALENDGSLTVSLEDITDVRVEKTTFIPLAARDVVVEREGGPTVALRVGSSAQDAGSKGPAKEFAQRLRDAARDAGAAV
jgi:hypothetical protein